MPRSDNLTGAVYHYKGFGVDAENDIFQLGEFRQCGDGKNHFFRVAGITQMIVNKTDRDHNVLNSLSHSMILTIFISLPTVKYEFSNFISILPVGKADDTLSPSLPRVRGRRLQLYPRTPWIWGILDFHSIKLSAFRLQKCGAPVPLFRGGKLE